MTNLPVLSVTGLGLTKVERRAAKEVAVTRAVSSVPASTERIVGPNLSGHTTSNYFAGPGLRCHPPSQATQPGPFSAPPPNHKEVFQMHHQPRSAIDTVSAVHGGVDRLVAKGVRPRNAVRRTARKYGINPKHAAALLAHGERPGPEALS